MDGYAERASRLYSPLQASCTYGARFGGSVCPPLSHGASRRLALSAPPSGIAQATVERRAEMAIYVRECALLLAA